MREPSAILTAEALRAGKTTDSTDPREERSCARAQPIEAEVEAIIQCVDQRTVPDNEPRESYGSASGGGAEVPFGSTSNAAREHHQNQNFSSLEPGGTLLGRKAPNGI
jgi:hypothetical protein